MSDFANIHIVDQVEAKLADKPGRLAPRAVPAAYWRPGPGSEFRAMLDLPNLLSLSRIAALPPLALLLATDRPWWAAGLFVAAAATDFFDGYLARRHGKVTAFGATLDPIADKVLVNGTALLLAGFGALGLWGTLAALLILVREFAVSGLRETAGGGALPVTRVAKYKSAAQMTALTLLIAAPELPPAAHELGVVLLWIAAALTLWTGAGYVRKALDALG